MSLLKVIEEAEWSESPSNDGRITAYEASHDGWRLLLAIAGPHTDGTATRGGTVVRLTREQALLARQRIEGGDSA